MIITLHTAAETKLRDAAPDLAVALKALLHNYGSKAAQDAANAALVLAGVPPR